MPQSEAGVGDCVFSWSQNATEKHRAAVSVPCLRYLYQGGNIGHCCKDLDCSFAIDAVVLRHICAGKCMHVLDAP